VRWKVFVDIWASVRVPSLLTDTVLLHGDLQNSTPPPFNAAWNPGFQEGALRGSRRMFEGPPGFLPHLSVDLQPIPIRALVSHLEVEDHVFYGSPEPRNICGDRRPGSAPVAVEEADEVGHLGPPGAELEKRWHALPSLRMIGAEVNQL
jgi:hypothetical protein